ncbi:fluoride efflux transporter CrcB [Chitiniphilus eburneus]|uniref:Fluoride-specific ion channel FluC n=1 Tax=Chitiniphilus eburneus TaxID=2571148 RepID=A0A4U0Q4S3_9NEIS|nr:fluoride efflux transporter CrcB [Chitiniphilus eburneus]TJZ76141.1 fluoride efflux transporter CrcB [Chitiniphilus eburneus]
MNPLAFLLIGLGAALGAWARWGLSVLMNPIVPSLPLGTLTANWIGGYLMGIALGAFSLWQTVSPEMRLFVTTGFLGGLTTFSTFSAEITTLALRQQPLWAIGGIVAHVAGSLALTWAGIRSVVWLKG